MMTIYVRTSSGKTISIKCGKKRKAVSVLYEVERRSTIPRSMTYLAHHGKVLNKKRTIEENNIGTETTIDTSLRLLGGMERSELMDALESEEDREKKGKLEETCEGKLMRQSEDAMFLRKMIIDALKRSDEKMESYSRKTDEKMEKFLQQISDTVGAQLHGMNSAIVKMIEEEDDRYKRINERFTGAHVERNLTGFHNETSEPEVIQLPTESVTEIGMMMENVRNECFARPITHAFIYFKNDEERDKFVRSANMLKKELRGRKSKISRSIDADERFHQKRMAYVKYCIHEKQNIPLDSITTNWTLKHISVKGQIVVRTLKPTETPAKEAAETSSKMLTETSQHA